MRSSVSGWRTTPCSSAPNRPEISPAGPGASAGASPSAGGATSVSRAGSASGSSTSTPSRLCCSTPNANPSVETHVVQAERQVALVRTLVDQDVVAGDAGLDRLAGVADAGHLDAQQVVVRQGEDERRGLADLHRERGLGLTLAEQPEVELAAADVDVRADPEADHRLAPAVLVPAVHVEHDGVVDLGTRGLHD